MRKLMLIALLITSFSVIGQNRRVIAIMAGEEDTTSSGGGGGGESTFVEAEEHTLGGFTPSVETTNTPPLTNPSEGAFVELARVQDYIEYTVTHDVNEVILKVITDFQYDESSALVKINGTTVWSDPRGEVPTLPSGGEDWGEINPISVSVSASTGDVITVGYWDGYVDYVEYTYTP